MKRVRQIARLGVAAALVLTPAAAAAQTDDRPTLQIGPFEFRPRLLFSNIGMDYNVFNEPTNPKRDFTATVTPDLELSVHPGRLRLAYTSGSEFVYFRKYASERSVNRSFSARADLDLTILKPFVSMSSTHTSARPNAEIDLRARHHPRNYAAGTALKLASRTALVFTARRSTEVYDEGLEFRGADLATSLDNKTTGYDTSLNFELTPFTTFSLVVSKEEQQFDHARVRDSNSLKVAPTLTFSPLGLITGTGSVGYRRFDGRDPSLPDYTGLVATGGIGVLFVNRYKLDTTFTRDVRYSYESALPYYLVTGARATLAVQTFGALDVRVLGGRESMDYRALAGAQPPGGDRLILYGAGFGYRLADRVRVIVEAEFSDRSSERDSARAYHNHRIVATLNWGALNR